MLDIKGRRDKRSSSGCSIYLLPFRRQFIFSSCVLFSFPLSEACWCLVLYFYFGKHTESQAAELETLHCHSLTFCCVLTWNIRHTLLNIYMKDFSCLALNMTRLYADANDIVCTSVLNRRVLSAVFYLRFHPIKYHIESHKPSSVFSMPAQLTWVYMCLLYRPFYWVIKELPWGLCLRCMCRGDKSLCKCSV